MLRMLSDVLTTCRREQAAWNNLLLLTFVPC